MQSSNLTRAVLGTLADAYPIAINLSSLAGESAATRSLLHRHLRLLLTWRGACPWKGPQMICALTEAAGPACTTFRPPSVYRRDYRGLARVYSCGDVRAERPAGRALSRNAMCRSSEALQMLLRTPTSPAII